MRKNSPRKWLHACLDLLPVFLIPVFMIYSHRHTLTEQAQAVPVYETNEVNSIDDIYANHIYHYDTLSPINEGGYSIYILHGDIVQNNLIGLDEIYIYDYDANYDNFIQILVDNTFTIFCSNSNGYIGYEVQNLTLNNIDFYIDGNDIILFKQEVEINGYGLPTSSNFNVYEIEQSSPNIMNVFIDSFNSSIDKYFNMGNVFNLSGVYDWFNTNIFSGNAPQVIYSIWNIALYELVMDLLFLLYGLFMWFIDMVQYLMDKPFKSIK